MDLQKVKNIAFEILKNTKSDKALSLYSSLEQGKMLRSRLILSICQSESAYDLCAIVELIQSASLLHDDVIDESELRRGKPSVNYQYGSKTAIMLGDILYSAAFHKLADFAPCIVKSIARSVSLLSIGELDDVELESSFNANEERYLRMIELKSATLIAASSECAGVLAGSHLDSKDSLESKDKPRSDSKNNLQGDYQGDSQIQKYYDYGLHLGIAFQIIDDILDITQDSKMLGKPNLSDFKSGKTTLPYIYLYDALDSKSREWLVSLHGVELDHKDSIKLIKMLEDSKALQKARDRARWHSDVAVKLAKELRNKELESIITAMVEREF